MQFAERMKSLRIKERYSQAQFSELVGVKPNTVWRWENDKAKPDFETVAKIARVLNTTSAYLLGETNFSTLPNDDKFTIQPTDKDEIISTDMLIIQDGNRKYLIPNNEEGRKLFLSVLSSGINGANIPVVSNTINGDNNSDNKLGIINN